MENDLLREAQRGNCFHCFLCIYTSSTVTSVTNQEPFFSYPFQTVTCVEDDWREQNVEEDLGVKGHLSHRQKQDHVTDQFTSGSRGKRDKTTGVSIK